MLHTRVVSLPWRCNSWEGRVCLPPLLLLLLLHCLCVRCLTTVLLWSVCMYVCMCVSSIHVSVSERPFVSVVMSAGVRGLRTKASARL